MIHGQWIGKIQGTSIGLAVVDLDEEDGHYRGHALYFPQDHGLPGSVASITTPDKSGEAVLNDVDIAPLDRRGSVIFPGQLSQVYPNAVHGAKADITLKLTDAGLLAVSYQTNFQDPVHGQIQTHGQGLLVRYDGSKPSEIHPVAEVTDWVTFKQFVGGLTARRFIYRGQPCLNRLRTSFHRTRRSDLVRYVNEDVPLAHSQLTPLTQHLFNLNDPSQTGAFYSLMQHHGYPTPLLDWTYSPFIGAFFAFRTKPEKDENVRIYILDRDAWVTKVSQFSNLTYLEPHMSIMELLGIENKRMIPQQALASVTNLDDIETHIRYIEQNLQCTLLQAVDLPASERSKVLDDLSLMGITAASLFPGFDGTCEALRGRMFGH